MLMIMVVAILGVLNTVLLGVRERSRDLGIFKGLGMTPGQTISMVICWVIAPAVAAGIIAVPIAVTLHSAVVRAMARAADIGIPAGLMDVYHVPELVLAGLAALVIAALGALIPARRVARSTTIDAWRPRQEEEVSGPLREYRLVTVVGSGGCERVCPPGRSAEGEPRTGYRARGRHRHEPSRRAV
jgi:predicted lysophospholipase L1 biosynthesis ABC-type transport system permease subunit